jgi:hypothetical protein
MSTAAPRTCGEEEPSKICVFAVSCCWGDGKACGGGILMYLRIAVGEKVDELVGRRRGFSFLPVGVPRIFERRVEDDEMDTGMHVT